MQIHSLGLDFYEDEYTLIGIHTTLEDYKLAYLLNKSLTIQLQQIKEGLDFDDKKMNTSFSLFNYRNNAEEFDWFLIANSTKKEMEKTKSDLQLETEVTSYLIPEKKKVDFFIKITGEQTGFFIANTIKKIKNIEQIITSYLIDKNSLKSKDFLTF